MKQPRGNKRGRPSVGINRSRGGQAFILINLKAIMPERAHIKKLNALFAIQGKKKKKKRQF